MNTQTDPYDPYNPSDEPQYSIRSDLWPTMNINELSNQLHLVMEKLTKIASMMGSVPQPTYMHMYGALQQAMQDLNGLIEYRTNNRQQGQ